jgi:thiol-disulfide isomerase/thioredoxin
MIEPTSYEEIASYVTASGKHLFYFSADWCGDCQFIAPQLPEIEAENPEFQFIHVDRDAFTDLAIEWGILGIPSFVAIENGQEIGRLVNKLRKTKEEINAFIAEIK